MAPVYATGPFALLETPAHNETDPDMFSRVASDMACIHNVVIRALNSIYLQAPHVAPNDVSAFVRYSLIWYDLLHVHHHGEETRFFPYIEAAAGQKGLMETSVEQHQAFGAGMEEFKAYLDDCAGGQQLYDGSKLVEIIDRFGETLSAHLGDEVSTLIELRKYGVERMGDLERKIHEEGESNMARRLHSAKQTLAAS